MVDLIRQLGDDQQCPATRIFFYRNHSAHPDGTAAGLVSIRDTLRTDDEAGRGEVGALNPLHDRGQRRLFVGVVILQRPEHRVRKLAEVVRGHVGRHADGDAAGSVGQQVGEPAGQHRGLLDPAVVIGYEIDSLLVDFTQHFHRQRRQSRLGISHGGRGVVARRTEVPLTVDQRIPQRPRLRHPHQRVIDGRVAVWVVIAHRLGDRARRLSVAAVRTEPGVVHRVQHPAVHRLEPVAHLRQRAAHDHAHRVIDVAALHLLLNINRLDPVD